jgi:hypothetical protein
MDKRIKVIVRDTTAPEDGKFNEKEFDVPFAYLSESTLVQNMLDDDEELDSVYKTELPIPLLNINSEQMTEIIRFMEVHVQKKCQIELPVHTSDFNSLVDPAYVPIIEDWFTRKPHAKYMKEIRKCADYLALDCIINLCEARIFCKIFDCTPLQALQFFGVADAEKQASLILDEMDKELPGFSDDIRKLDKPVECGAGAGAGSA